MLNLHCGASILHHYGALHKIWDGLWLFSDTPKGADSSAVIYSLVESAKANDIEPRSYLWFLLDEMRYLDKSPSAEKLDTLMPWSPGIRKLLEKEYS